MSVPAHPPLSFTSVEKYRKFDLEDQIGTEFTSAPFQNHLNPPGMCNTPYVAHCREPSKI
jgi:hypothetical protein